MTSIRRPMIRVDLALAAAVVVILVSASVSAVLARPATLDDRERGLAGQLRCPTCQGLAIADSPATAAEQMRRIIRDRLEAGASDEEVRAYFVDRYGRWILIDPPTDGLDLALWVVPPAIVVLGALLVVRRSRARGTGGSVGNDPGPVGSSGRVTIAIGLGMALALLAPVVVALTPRGVGQEITGASTTAESLADLAAWVDANPTNPEALVVLADALLAEDRIADAAERYRAALELDPDYIPALLGLGMVLLSADRPGAAGPVFDRVLLLEPDHADALLYRALARIRQDGWVSRGARIDLERFLSVGAPDDARRSMATSLLGRSDARDGATPRPSADAPR